MAHIMLVDDQLETLTLIRIMLERVGFTVSAVPSASAALDLIDQQKIPPPDLFLLDIAMPDVNGFELLKMLKNRPLTRRAPVMMLTAVNDPESVAEARALGAKDYLVKPVLARVLVAKVRRWLPEHHDILQ
jgi:CheY-like chemotaxis protein